MNQDRPLVSIGLPVYNGERYLQEAIDSILAQTCDDFELIISDNGSSDRTEAICRAYAKRDSRIRYVREAQNRGAGWNFDRVFELARGKYFRWACHDDICAPNLLAKCVAILESQAEVVLAYPQTIIIDETGKQLSQYDDNFQLTAFQPAARFKRYLQLVRNGHGCHPFFGLIRTDILQKLLPLGSYPSSDLVLLGKLTLYGTFSEISEPLFLKRDHPQSSVRAHNAFRERIAWYDPQKRGKLHLTRWKWLREYVSAIAAAPVSSQVKVRCYLLLMTRWLVWNWLWLAKDLLKAASWPLLKLVLRPKIASQSEKLAQS
jgi:glycosyltransferase involved in cell wall biosynthesis